MCLLQATCVPLHKTEQYVSTDYDFSIFVVCALLSAITDECNSTDASQLFICNVCKTCLSKANNISASVPIYSYHPIARSGAQFLKALQEKPEYICTCCHCLLFQQICCSVPCFRFHYDTFHCKYVPIILVENMPGLN